MADRRYKLLGQGLVGDSSFKVGDLAEGEVLYWNATTRKWTNTDAVSIDPAGAVVLKYNGVNALATRQDTGLTGISIADEAGTFRYNIDVSVTNNETVFHNTLDNDVTRFVGEVTGGVQRTMLSMDPDDGVTLYQQGIPFLKNFTTFGASVVSDNTGNCQLELQTSNGNDIGRVIGLATRFELRAGQDFPGIPVRLTSWNAAGNAINKILEGDPDGATNTYYNGVAKHSTSAVGTLVDASTGTDSEISVLRQDQRLILRSYWESGVGQYSLVLATNNAESADTPLRLRGSDVELYDGGNLHFRTTAGGVDIIRGGNNASVCSWYNSDGTTRNAYIQGNIGGSFLFRNDLPSGTVIIQGETSAPATYTMMTLNPNSGVTIGNPTGGYQGQGSLNVDNGVYDDGAGPLTDYVFDAALDGDVDTDKWDREMPNKLRDVLADDGTLIGRETIHRNHEPARSFKARQDDLDPKAYGQKWRQARKLPAFSRRGRAKSGALSLGESTQRLLETCEVQAVHIDKLLTRIEALETRLDEYTATDGKPGPAPTA